VNSSRVIVDDVDPIGDPMNIDLTVGSVDTNRILTE
jgi:hypothetical protein